MFTNRLKIAPSQQVSHLLSRPVSLHLNHTNIHLINQANSQADGLLSNRQPFPRSSQQVNRPLPRQCNRPSHHPTNQQLNLLAIPPSNQPLNQPLNHQGSRLQNLADSLLRNRANNLPVAHLISRRTNQPLNHLGSRPSFLHLSQPLSHLGDHQIIPADSLLRNLVGNRLVALRNNRQDNQVLDQLISRPSIQRLSQPLNHRDGHQIIPADSLLRNLASNRPVALLISRRTNQPLNHLANHPSIQHISQPLNHRDGHQIIPADSLLRNLASNRLVALLINRPANLLEDQPTNQVQFLRINLQINQLYSRLRSQSYNLLHRQRSNLLATLRCNLREGLPVILRRCHQAYRRLNLLASRQRCPQDNLASIRLDNQRHSLLDNHLPNLLSSLIGTRH